MYKIKNLNEIINKTIQVVDESKIEILLIAENSISECKRVEAELQAVKAQTAEVIRNVDLLSILDKDCRYKLMIVSRNIKQYSENDIRQAYEKAKDIQVKLATKKNDEHILIEKRNELERRYMVYKETAEKAEGLVTRVNVVMEYLGGGLKDISNQIEDIKMKRDISIRIIKAQEDERRRLAREIHDGPAQTMANLVIKSEICEKLIDIDNEKAKKELRSFRDTVRLGLGDIRKIIYDLRPMSLDDLGLIPSIQNLVKDFSLETGIFINIKSDIKEELIAPVIEIALFRIIQEALNNVRKHSNAKDVNLRLETNEKYINLLFWDNGVGFDVKLEKKTEVESGYGLTSMRERAELLSGKFNISSSSSNGTKIYVSIPLDMESE